MMSSEAEIELMDQDDESTPNRLLPLRTTDKLENLFVSNPMELGPVFLIVNLANFEDETLRPNPSTPSRGLKKLDNLRICIQILGGRPYFHSSPYLVNEAIPIAFLTNDAVYNRRAINRWHELEATRGLRRDIFNENFIHEIVGKPTSEELTYDLNAHRIGSSIFKPYNANNFIKNKVKWSELLPKAEIQGLSPRCCVKMLVINNGSSNANERRPSSPPPVVSTKKKQLFRTTVHSSSSSAEELITENDDDEEMEDLNVNQLGKLPKCDVKVSSGSKKTLPFNLLSEDKTATSTGTSSRASSVDVFDFENEISNVASSSKRQGLRNAIKSKSTTPSPRSIQKRQSPITFREQKAMLDFIIANNYYSRVMSRTLYVEMVDKEVVKNRTSVTLASNMQKIVLRKKLYSFMLSKHIITKFEKYRDSPASSD